MGVHVVSFLSHSWVEREELMYASNSWAKFKCEFCPMRIQVELIPIDNLNQKLPITCHRHCQSYHPQKCKDKFLLLIYERYILVFVGFINWICRLSSIIFIKLKFYYTTIDRWNSIENKLRLGVQSLLYNVVKIKWSRVSNATFTRISLWIY